MTAAGCRSDTAAPRTARAPATPRGRTDPRGSTCRAWSRSKVADSAMVAQLLLVDAAHAVDRDLFDQQLVGGQHFRRVRLALRHGNLPVVVAPSARTYIDRSLIGTTCRNQGSH